MDFRDRLPYDLMWETMEKWLQLSTFYMAYFVDVEGFSKPGKKKLHRMSTHFFSLRSKKQINELKQGTG